MTIQLLNNFEFKYKLINELFFNFYLTIQHFTIFIAQLLIHKCITFPLTIQFIIFYSSINN